MQLYEFGRVTQLDWNGVIHFTLVFLFILLKPPNTRIQVRLYAQCVCSVSSSDYIIQCVEHPEWVFSLMRHNMRLHEMNTFLFCFFHFSCCRILPTGISSNPNRDDTNNVAHATSSFCVLIQYNGIVRLHDERQKGMQLTTKWWTRWEKEEEREWVSGRETTINHLNNVFVHTVVHAHQTTLFPIEECATVGCLGLGLGEWIDTRNALEKLKQ